MKEQASLPTETQQSKRESQKFRKLKDWGISNLYSGAMFIGSAFTAGIASVGLFAAGVVTEVRSFARLTRPEVRQANQTHPQNRRTLLV